MGKSLLNRGKKTTIAALFISTTALSSQVALAELCHIKLRNHSSFRIREVHMSRVGEDKWGKNLVDDIHDKTIWQGQSVNLRFEDRENNCLYDMKVMGEDEDDQEIHRVNICNNSDFEITDDE
ncbi:hypothetical protein [Calothrix sp. PCC 6303]|uniref:hypothetical protein n=1 Tax=Calothrix sp. PCC 6303 TaxID=1170562 RepID=UPI0002A05159|nr:hypothetical protein [Calothrix sp. PCC 6303]AFZ00098.1 hypothetical protein Cal6303_1034 [Calothrix sp. PCC 6303]